MRKASRTEDKRLSKIGRRDGKGKCEGGKGLHKYLIVELVRNEVKGVEWEKECVENYIIYKINKRIVTYRYLCSPFLN